MNNYVLIIICYMVLNGYIYGDLEVVVNNGVYWLIEDFSNFGVWNNYI